MWRDATLLPALACNNEVALQWLAVCKLPSEAAHVPDLALVLALRPSVAVQPASPEPAVALQDATGLDAFECLNREGAHLAVFLQLFGFFQVQRTDGAQLVDFVMLCEVRALEPVNQLLPLAFGEIPLE